MKKHIYRTKNINAIDWIKIKEQLQGSAVVFAIDVAKEKQFALLSNPDATVSELLSWSHPMQTLDVVMHLKSLACPITVVMESTGTYGDVLRYQFRRSGFEVNQISAKRVSDARELYDGVPSLHDAKSATVIMRLHGEGLSRPWRESTDKERELDSLRREYDLHQSQYQRNQNRLEAYLSRHWPEVLPLLPLDSLTLESLLIEYGCPEQIAKSAEDAAKKMRLWGKSKLKDEKIAAVIQSAVNSIGQPCIEAERHYLQALSTEMRHSRQQQKEVKDILETTVKADSGLDKLASVIGLVTTAVLISCRLDPRNFSNARSFQKALGLNLKEKSSGRYIGKLKITKRGCSIVRRYLYLATLRLINNDPVIKEWYQQKVDARAKIKTVIALMRKLAKALWYIGRGDQFSAKKLISATA